jgi:hypothetical protein
MCFRVNNVDENARASAAGLLTSKHVAHLANNVDENARASAAGLLTSKHVAHLARGTPRS